MYWVLGNILFQMICCALVIITGLGGYNEWMKPLLGVLVVHGLLFFLVISPR